MLAEQQKAQGYTISKDWRNHDQQFLWYAALMQGRGDEAVQAARALAERASGSPSAFGDYRRSLPTLALLRLQRWDAVLAEPMAVDRKGLAQALGEEAHGVAYVRLGRMREAKAALQRADAGATKLVQAYPSPSGTDRLLRDMASAATDRLRAEIASAEGRHDAAIAYQADAFAASRRADDNEPPMLAGGDRLALGDLQLRAGRTTLAERTFRDDLAAHPGSGWALAGLTRALRAQGKVAEAETLAPQLAQAWAVADGGLRVGPR